MKVPEAGDRKIKFGGVGDDYVLGIICAKTGLTARAIRNLINIQGCR